MTVRSDADGVEESDRSCTELASTDDDDDDGVSRKTTAAMTIKNDDGDIFDRASPDEFATRLKEFLPPDLRTV
jgi:hypothetical protein